jgi:hypothetical protein
MSPPHMLFAHGSQATTRVQDPRRGHQHGRTMLVILIRCAFQLRRTYQINAVQTERSGRIQTATSQGVEALTRSLTLELCMAT